ncbi:uncharacterized protein LOC119694197 [Plutella xylostella]|uniref:uncharacterized protein LOC119694197 n=1 Tax=Plutella xylostella TaxID=51655 RepID=UPI0020327AAB|nr:uncharacterized protein LOC119694197 [Plutella xylostella]
MEGVSVESWLHRPPPAAQNWGRDSVQAACRGAARHTVRRDSALPDNDTYFVESVPNFKKFKHLLSFQEAVTMQTAYHSFASVCIKDAARMTEDGNYKDIKYNLLQFKKT